MVLQVGDLLAPPAPPGGERRGEDAWRGDAVRVLLVSESTPWRAEMGALLEAEGYVVRVDGRGDAALAPTCPFDIALVDLAISGRSTAVVFAALRARTSIPIMAVAPGGHGELAALEAYAAGADQIVTRSVRQHELMARIRALLRRTPPRRRAALQGGPGSLSLDIESGVVTIGSSRIRLTTREADILHALLERPGRVVTREQLAESGRSRDETRFVDAQVRSVRSKLEAAEGRRRIIAVRGVGFRLLPDGELDRWSKRQ